MAKGDSPTRGRELNIHFGDLERGFIGQISQLGDMVPVMAGVTLTFKMRKRASRRPRLRRRRRDLHRRVPRGDQLRRGAALPARRRSSRTTATPTRRRRRSRRAAEQLVDKARGLRHPRRAGRRQRRLATYEVTKRRRRSRAARRRRHAGRADDLPPEGPRRARQPVATCPPARSSAGRARTIRSTATSQRLTDERGRGADASSTAIDARVRRRSTRRPTSPSGRRRPSRATALVGVYADPPEAPALWFREGSPDARSTAHERPASWGTHDG